MLLPALAVLSAVIVAAMVRIGTIDHPVARSSHTIPTPKGGGVGIVAAFAAGMLLRPAYQPGDVALTLAAILLAAVSYADDVWNGPFWLKLGSQAVAACVIVGFGIVPHGVFVPGFGTVPLGFAGPALGVIWVIFVANAVNFMDGLNGLAAGTAGVVCLTVAIAGSVAATWPACLIVAAVAGFLPFNYPAARIFMGDVGSQFIGFVLAGLALRYAADPHLSMILPLGLLALLLDVVFTLVRRWRAGARLTEAHRGHLYQVAQRSGIPAWAITLVYWAMAAFGSYMGAVWAEYPALGVPLLVPVVFATWAFTVMRSATRAKLHSW